MKNTRIIDNNDQQKVNIKSSYNRYYVDKLSMCSLLDFKKFTFYEKKLALTDYTNEFMKNNHKFFGPFRKMVNLLKALRIIKLLKK